MRTSNGWRGWSSICKSNPKPSAQVAGGSRFRSRSNLESGSQLGYMLGEIYAARRATPPFRYMTIATSEYGLGILSDTGAADIGLICAFAMSPSAPPQEIDLDEIDELSEGSFAWLHFNLSNARARHLLAHARFIPDELKEVFKEHDGRRRIESLETGLLVSIGDLAFDADSDVPEVAPLWCFMTPRLFITARTHALKTTDQLRSAVRGGMKVASTVELLTWILAHRTATLRGIADEMTEQVGEIEDEILAGSIKQQREQLGRIRRFCARLRRHFAPDRSAFLKMLQRQPALLSGEHVDLIRSEVDELSFLADEVNELYERAKLLQEELASRVAEDTGRSLYVLAILSAVFLPMTLITGVFGMNVAGLPGLTGTESFWWVMVLIVAAGAATLASIFSRSRS